MPPDADDRTPQQPEMRLAQLLRRVRTEPRRGRGRIHQIREHERRRYRRRQPTHPTPEDQSRDSDTPPGQRAFHRPPPHSSHRVRDGIRSRQRWLSPAGQISASSDAARLVSPAQPYSAAVAAAVVTRSRARSRSPSAWRARQRSAWSSWPSAVQNGACSRAWMSCAAASQLRPGRSHRGAWRARASGRATAPV